MVDTIRLRFTYLFCLRLGKVEGLGAVGEVVGVLGHHLIVQSVLLRPALRLQDVLAVLIKPEGEESGRRGIINNDFKLF